MSLVTDATALIRHLSLVLTAGQIAPGSDNELLMVNALNATPVTASSSADVKQRRVWAAVLMIMACPQYLIQK